MGDEFSDNLIRGMKWLPIKEKAMEIIEEFEKRNEHDEFYKMGLSDVLYYALVLFYDEIISHDGNAHDLIKNIREEFISAQEKDMRFMMEFGALDNSFSRITDEIRQKNKYGNWKGR